LLYGYSDGKLSGRLTSIWLTDYDDWISISVSCPFLCIVIGLST